MKIYNSPEIPIIELLSEGTVMAGSTERDMKIWMILGQIGNYITNSENSSSVQI